MNSLRIEHGAVRVRQDRGLLTQIGERIILEVLSVDFFILGFNFYFIRF